MKEMTEKARTYAIVLYELGIPGAMAEAVDRLMEENPALKEALTSPVVPRKKKHDIIERVFREPDFSALMVRFLKKACDAGCIGQMEGIVEAWKAHSLKMEGIMEAELCYVTQPDETQIAGMKRFLCTRYHKKDVILRLMMQPDLMGGFVLKAGDTEYDYSLRGQMGKLRQAVVR